MITFKRETKDKPEYFDITIQNSDIDADLTEMAKMFHRFLAACGYYFNEVQIHTSNNVISSED